jgi:hypothetical protein
LSVCLLMSFAFPFVRLLRVIPANLWNTKSGSWPSFLNENEGHNT